MIVPEAGSVHLTYCTNIHPGESLEQVQQNIVDYVLKVKAQVAPHGDFGLGLWLSRLAVNALRENKLDEFKQFLDNHDLYLFTLNGFPYGDFHERPLKEKVYLPDWTDDDRMAYTDYLALALSSLMPDWQDFEASISTVPVGFAKKIKSENDVQQSAERFLHAAGFLLFIEQNFNKKICLAIEPEPFCYLDTIDQVVDFFKEHLFGTSAVSKVAYLAKTDRATAEKALHERLGVCLDACHLAVGFEDPKQVLKKLTDAGIRIAKAQISAGLEIPKVDEDALVQLESFADDLYLHQVVEKVGDQINRYLDLPHAIAAAREKKLDRTWRVHFHVPLYQEKLGQFVNTRPFLDDFIPLLVHEKLTRHFEVETYTWEVLPEQYRWMKVESAIAREIEWVRKKMSQ